MAQTTPSRDDNGKPEPDNLRWLRRLVLALTVTMTLGLIIIVTVIVMTFFGPRNASLLPDGIQLPAGEVAEAFTQGKGWAAIVTRDATGHARIHVLSPKTGAIRQTVQIEETP